MLKVQRARRRFLNYLVLTLAGAILAIPAYADDITGKPRVIDGDTIEIAGERIRLHGIDAPESEPALNFQASAAAWQPDGEGAKESEGCGFKSRKAGPGGFQVQRQSLPAPA